MLDCFVRKIACSLSKYYIFRSPIFLIMSLNRLFCPHCETYVDVEITSVARSCVCPGCGKMIFLQFTSKESRQKRKALLMPTEPQPVAVEAPVESRVMEVPPAPLEPAPVVPQMVYQPMEPMKVVEPVKVAHVPVQSPPPQKAPPQVFVSPTVADAPVKPRVLSDNVVDRMVHDPEVRTNKRKFVVGVVLVLFLIILTILGNKFQWWSTVSNSVADLSQKILVKGNVESRDAVAAETAEKNSKGNPKTSVDPASNPPVITGNLSERDQAQAAVAAFLSAKDISVRLLHVRDHALTEKMMREYYARAKDGPIPFEKVEEIEINPEGENTFAYHVTLSGTDKRRMLVAKSASGQYHIDWASFVLYGEMDWNTLMEKKPENPVLMRVLVTSDSYFANEFSDRNRYGCLKLTDPSQSSAPPIYAYFTSSSTLGRSLNFVMRSSLDQAVPMTLTLKYPGNSKGNNQVLINEMVTQGWVTRGR